MIWIIGGFYEWSRGVHLLLFFHFRDFAWWWPIAEHHHFWNQFFWSEKTMALKKLSALNKFNTRLTLRLVRAKNVRQTSTWQPCRVWMETPWHSRFEAHHDCPLQIRLSVFLPDITLFSAPTPSSARSCKNWRTRCTSCKMKEKSRWALLNTGCFF